MQKKHDIVDIVKYQKEVSTVELFTGVQHSLWEDFFSPIELLLEKGFTSNKKIKYQKNNPALQQGIKCSIPFDNLGGFSSALFYFFESQGFGVDLYEQPGIVIQDDEQLLGILKFHENGLELVYLHDPSSLLIFLLTLNFISKLDESL